jgi:hypothetical protein
MTPSAEPTSPSTRRATGGAELTSTGNIDQGHIFYCKASKNDCSICSLKVKCTTSVARKVTTGHAKQDTNMTNTNADDEAGCHMRRRCVGQQRHVGEETSDFSRHQHANRGQQDADDPQQVLARKRPSAASSLRARSRQPRAISSGRLSPRRCASPSTPTR